MQAVSMSQYEEVRFSASTSRNNPVTTGESPWRLSRTFPHVQGVQIHPCPHRHSHKVLLATSNVRDHSSRGGARDATHFLRVQVALNTGHKWRLEHVKSSSCKHTCVRCCGHLLCLWQSFNQVLLFLSFLLTFVSPSSALVQRSYEGFIIAPFNMGKAMFRGSFSF